MAHTMEDPLDINMQKCVQNCTDCHNACVQTISHCLDMGGSHTDAAHLRSLLDCADACDASVRFMLRGSELYPQMCGVCADACLGCALSCEQWPNDPVMKTCAEVCRLCADSCREMAAVKV